MVEPAVMPTLNAGYQVVLILAALAVLVMALGVWLVIAERRLNRRPLFAIDEPESAAKPPAGTPADVSMEALQQSLSSLEHFDRLQQELGESLKRSRSEMDADRGSVGSVVELMKRAAIEMRLPETVYEIYESLRLLPKKTLEAQEADHAWHRQVGIAPGRVLVFDEAMRYSVVDFSVSGRAFRISGRSYELSRSSFDELTLFDGRESAVLTVRVKLHADRTSVLESAVMSYRPNDWLRLLVESRVRMDERRERVLLGARHRDVEKMRADFGVSVSLPGWTAVR